MKPRNTFQTVAPMLLLLAALLLSAVPGCKGNEPAVTTTAPQTTLPATTPTTTPPTTTPPATTPPATTPPVTTPPPTTTPSVVVEPGQNIKFTGTIQTIGADSWVIGGKTFAVSTSTVRGQGLAVGATATVEFILAVNGALTATKIETPAADDRVGENFHFTGAIISITAGTYVIGGQTFKTNAATFIDTGLAVGVTATVEFTVQADGSKMAKEIETKAQGAAAGEDFKFTGVIGSIGATAWTIGGKTFIVNAATIKDQGLATGVIATAEFLLAADGSMIAKKIQTPAVGEKADIHLHFKGAIQSITATAYVIGGQTFITDVYTIFDTGLAVGVPATVEFVVQAGGSKLAVNIQTP